MPKIKHILPIIIVAMLLIFPAAAFAQDDPGAEPIPLDGGLTVLIAAGVGYGVKKIKDNRVEKREARRQNGL